MEYFVKDIVPILLVLIGYAVLLVLLIPVVEFIDKKKKAIFQKLFPKEETTIENLD